MKLIKVGLLLSACAILINASIHFFPSKTLKANDSSKNDCRYLKNEKCSQKMEKINFQGHTYILWSGWKNDGCFHDPDCKCKFQPEILR